MVAFEAVAGAKILEKWVPSVPQWVFSLALMLLLTVTNLLSARSFGETEFWLASIKVTTIVVFMVLGCLFVLGLWPGAHLSVGNITQDGFVANGAFSVIHGVVIVIFSYFGAEIVTVAAAESSEPEKAVQQATATTVWRVILFYAGSIALIVMIIPWRDVPTETSPFAATFGKFGIPAAETIVSAVVLTAALSVLNSGLYTASRMLFALKRPRLGPALGRRHERARRAVEGDPAVHLGRLRGRDHELRLPDRIFYFIINSAGAVALFVYAIIAGTLLVVVSMLFVEDARSQLYLSLLSLAAVLGIYQVIRRR
ncbi:amino acid permease [Amycolatopsis sp. NPDC059657]|uniref:amino acid permease n=1 Tax=Amycolatopsis sp. NPDC059657 TaxID=3346899 RepID=UPI00366D18DB